MDVMEEVSQETEKAFVKAYGPKETWDSRTELLFHDLVNILLNLI